MISQNTPHSNILEKTNDGLYAINNNSMTTALIIGYQNERKERQRLEERIKELEGVLQKILK